MDILSHLIPTRHCSSYFKEAAQFHPELKFRFIPIYQADSQLGESSKNPREGIFS